MLMDEKSVECTQIAYCGLASSPGWTQGSNEKVQGLVPYCCIGRIIIAVVSGSHLVFSTSITI